MPFPLLLWPLLGITTVGSGFLVLSSGIEKTGDAVEDVSTKLLLPLAGALGLYAAYKVLQKM